MTWIQTYSGRSFSLTEPRPEDVDIEDIVQALGNICRFAGHCRFYSVLQHSIHVSDLLPERLRYAGLMHDAPEAYYGDITRPQKTVLAEISGGRFKDYLGRIDAAVFASLGIPQPLPEKVKHADDVMLATEARDLLLPPPLPWESLPKPLWSRVECWEPPRTHREFYSRYHALRP